MSERCQGHRIAVKTDTILTALEPLASCGTPWRCCGAACPPDTDTDALRAVPCELDEQLRKATLANLRRDGLARDYFILSPISPMNPPGPEDMEKIAAALRPLADLGLIITL